MDKRIDFKRIKLLSVGDYKNDKNGKPTIKVTEKVLDGMIDAFNDFKNNTLPDVIIDHKDTKEQRDKAFTVPDDKGNPKEVFGRLPFSVGKIDNLVKVGKDLYGDFINVFEPIKNAITDKLLTSLSSEFFLDIKSNVTGKNYDGVLTAVAILPGGTWAELYDKFKPYIFNLDDANQLQKFSLESFESENKVICKLQDFEKGTSQMSEKDYQKKMQKFMDKKMKCASYEQFMGMDENAQQEYMSMMEDKYKKFSLSEYGEKETMEEKDLSLDVVKASNEKVANLEKQVFSLMEQIKTGNDDKVKSLELQLETMKKAEVRKDVIKFVNDRLIESNKFDPADREKLENGLTSIAMLTNQAIKFSVGGSEIEQSPYNFITEILEKAQVKNTFSHTPIVKTGENGLTVTKADIEASGGASADEILLDKKIRFSNQDKDFSKMSEAELQAIYEKEGILS